MSFPSPSLSHLHGLFSSQHDLICVHVLGPFPRHSMGAETHLSPAHCFIHTVSSSAWQAVGAQKISGEWMNEWVPLPEVLAPPTWLSISWPLSRDAGHVECPTARPLLLLFLAPASLQLCFAGWIPVLFGGLTKDPWGFLYHLHHQGTCPFKKAWSPSFWDLHREVHGL